MREGNECHAVYSVHLIQFINSLSPHNDLFPSLQKQNSLPYSCKYWQWDKVKSYYYYFLHVCNELYYASHKTEEWSSLQPNGESWNDCKPSGSPERWQKIPRYIRMSLGSHSAAITAALLGQPLLPLAPTRTHSSPNIPVELCSREHYLVVLHVFHQQVL